MKVRPRLEVGPLIPISSKIKATSLINPTSIPSPFHSLPIKISQVKGTLPITAEK
jgi:hypothetical protein